MRILAVDTATEVCGLALFVNGQVMAERSIAQGVTHSKVLMEALSTLLQEAGLDMATLDGLAVTRGPGSFTGLRIGISTVKGLVLATGKPLVGVSTLAVLAHQAPGGTPWVCPMIDARRKEVYWSLYRRQGDNLLRMLPEQAGSVVDAVNQLGREPCLFIGNGAQLYAAVIGERLARTARLADAGLHALQPGMVARLGAQRLAQGHRDDVRRFIPVYLRPSDAQVPTPR
ncbi:MAG: tRNA (adenosine(37)-N6)-threonylcarbamoyltransferase complex dimerization subunit type 1 TsaB [Desulfatitalea sp.]